MPMTSIPSIECEKCKSGTMVATLVPRTSQGQRLLGFALVSLTVLIAASMVAGSVFMFINESDAVSAARRHAADQLLDIGSVRHSVIEDFEADGTIDKGADLSLVVLAERPKVDEILATYQARVRRTTPISDHVFGLLVGGVIGAPFLVAGLLLTRRKRVWKCPTCGHVFDRTP